MNLTIKTREDHHCAYYDCGEYSVCESSSIGASSVAATTAATTAAAASTAAASTTDETVVPGVSVAACRSKCEIDAENPCRNSSTNSGGGGDDYNVFCYHPHPSVPILCVR